MKGNNIQAKHRKDTIVFGKDRVNYFNFKNSRASTQEMANVSKETKEAADGVRRKLMSHNFKFGSYKQDYSSASIAGDKVILSKEAKDEKYKQPSASKIKQKMANTQSSWLNKNPLKSFDSQSNKSRSGLEARENSEHREIHPNNHLLTHSNVQPMPNKNGKLPFSKSNRFVLFNLK